MDIGWQFAYNCGVPQRGAVIGGIKSHGEETQEGQENRSEKVVADEDGLRIAGRFLQMSPGY